MRTVRAATRLRDQGFLLVQMMLAMMSCRQGAIKTSLVTIGVTCDQAFFSLERARKNAMQIAGYHS